MTVATVPRSLVREVAKSKARRVDTSLTQAELALLPDADIRNLKLAAEAAYLNTAFKNAHPYSKLAERVGIELLRRGHKPLSDWEQIQEDIRNGLARVRS